MLNYIFFSFNMWAILFFFLMKPIWVFFFHKYPTFSDYLIYQFDQFLIVQL
jgi:hypothetical protein